MTLELRGTPAAPGATVAAPWILRPAVIAAPASLPLAEAVEAAAAEVGELASRLRDRGRESEAEILDAQAMIAMDPSLREAADELIAGGSDPASAIVQAGEAVATTFEAIGDEILAARGADVRDVAARIARVMTGAASATARAALGGRGGRLATLGDG